MNFFISTPFQKTDDCLRSFVSITAERDEYGEAPSERIPIQGKSDLGIAREFPPRRVEQPF
jgi:hypothetical protein